MLALALSGVLSVAATLGREGVEMLRVSLLLLLLLVSL